jgi:hypothetical protein
MIEIHGLLFICHIVLGTIALITFWIPIASKKGGINHVKFGRYYGFIMYSVALSGAVMATLVIIDPMAIKGHLLQNSANKEAFVQTIRVFWGFLLYLSLLTYVSIRQGFAVLKHKQNVEALKTLRHLIPIILLGLGGALMTYLGVQQDRILHIVFGILGIIISTGMLRYCLSKELKHKQWVIEHLGAMIGSGIGAYTAFFAFGGRQLFENLGNVQIYLAITRQNLNQQGRFNEKIFNSHFTVDTNN